MPKSPRFNGPIINDVIAEILGSPSRNRVNAVGRDGDGRRVFAMPVPQPPDESYYTWRAAWREWVDNLGPDQAEATLESLLSAKGINAEVSIGRASAYRHSLRIRVNHP